MKLELLNKKDNRVLARTELDFEVRDAKLTPTIKDLRQNISSAAGTKVDLTIISIARHVFGSSIVRGKARIYKEEKAMKAIDDAFKLIEKENLNPIQVFAEAIENSAPREDTTRFKKGGVAQTQSVDVSPLKRIDESIKNIAVAAFQQSFKSKVTVSEALAKELMLAAKQNNQSFAVKRRDEVERIAQSSR
mgnify:CR=1 FL=1